ncbi:MAG: hypothetical protein ACRDXC_02130 [Acidimicrobiales bacterium]
MRKLPVRLLGWGMVISIGLLASACGGASTPGVASLGSTTTTTAAAAAQGTSGSSTKRGLGIEYAKCMHSHGVKDFPETGGPVKISPSSGLNPTSPTFRAASKACRSLLPRPSAAQQRQAEQNALKFSKCMRSHGVTSFPDPKFSSTGGGISIKISSGTGGGLNPTSPTFQAAQRTCSKYVHFPKGGPRKQGSGAVVAP